MKYLITESQLDKIIFKFLDSLNYEIIKKTVDAPVGAIKTSVFYFSNNVNSGYADIVYYTWRGDLFVTTELCDTIVSFFSLEEVYDAKFIISDWVSKKIKKEVDKVHNYKKNSFSGENTFKFIEE